MIHLIQGFFLRISERLDISFRGKNGELTTGVKKELSRCMYSGIIYPDPNNKSQLVGRMFDQDGKESVLFNITKTPKTITFIKQYYKGGYGINYRFRRKDNVWVGSYEGENIKKKKTKCVITEVPDDFFL